MLPQALLTRKGRRFHATCLGCELVIRQTLIRVGRFLGPVIPVTCSRIFRHLACSLIAADHAPDRRPAAQEAKHESPGSSAPPAPPRRSRSRRHLSWKGSRFMVRASPDRGSCPHRSGPPSSAIMTNKTRLAALRGLLMLALSLPVGAMAGSPSSTRQRPGPSLPSWRAAASSWRGAAAAEEARDRTRCANFGLAGTGTLRSCAGPCPLR